MAVVAVLILLSFLILGDTFREGVPIATIILWGGFLSWVYSNPLLRQRLPRVSRLAFLFGGVLLTLVAGKGYEAGRKTFHEAAKATLTLQSGQQLTASVLRTLERGIIVRPAGSESAVFVPWSEVKLTITRLQQHRFPGLLCTSFGKCWPEVLAEGIAR